MQRIGEARKGVERRYKVGMSILDEIQASLKSISKLQRKNVRRDFVSAMSIIEEKDIEVVEEKIENALESHLPNGEKIVSEIKVGDIIDGGNPYFKILGGYVIEFYDYDTTTSVFIRNYLISDGGKDWVAVYIDQNPKTPWWNQDQ
jgi:hypothetical protein